MAHSRSGRGRAYSSTTGAWCMLKALNTSRVRGLLLIEATRQTKALLDCNLLASWHAVVIVQPPAQCPAQCPAPAVRRGACLLTCSQAS